MMHGQKNIKLDSNSLRIFNHFIIQLMHTT